MPTLGERIQSVWGNFRGGKQMKTPEELGFNRAPSMQEFLSYTNPSNVRDGHVYKAVIPQWFYKPPWGLPLQKDILEIRRLSGTPFVSIVRNTITHEIEGLDWAIKVEEGAQVPPDVVLKTKRFLYNPNRNDESLGYIFKQLVGDSIEIDGAVLEKVRNLNGDLVEIYARDAGLFTKAPDMHGVMPEIDAFWQYSWTVGTPPIPFNKRDMIYMIRNPRTDTVYGRGEVEVLYSVLRLLLYGIEDNLDYFTETQTAKGFLQLSGATPQEIERFRTQWNQMNLRFDSGGLSRRKWNQVPISGTEVKFVPTGFTNVELELLEQQKWFSKLVWACFGMSPSEVGFTEDVNRATAYMESASVKRKILKPFMMMLEYYFDIEVINELPWIKGKYEDMIHFQFDRSDLGYEKAEREIIWNDYDRGLITKNQALEQMGLPKITGGDVYKDENAGIGFGQTTANTHPIDDSLLGMKLNIDRSHKIDDSLLDMPINLERPEEKAVPGQLDPYHSFGTMWDETYNNAWDSKKKQLDDLAESQFGRKFLDLDINEQQAIVNRYGTKAETSSTPLTIKEFEELNKHLKEIDFDFNETLKKILKQKELNAETKALPTWEGMLAFVLGIVDFGGIKKKIGDAVKNAFNRGLDLGEVDTNQNFVPDPHTVQFLERYAFDNIKNLEGSFRHDLQEMMIEHYKNGQSVEDLQDKIRGVFDVTQSRARTIAVTEANRALNAGRLQAYKDSGLTGKVVWVAQDDTEPGHPCYELDGMQVSPGELFEVKGFKGQGPPAHPSCKCQIKFVTKR